MGLSRLLLLCLALVVCVVLSSDLKNNGEIKRQQLISMSKGGVVHLDDSNYVHFVRSRPRPYSIVLMFTANDPGHQCAICRTLSPEFETLAESYWTQRSEGESASRATADIFFAIVDYKNSKDTFKQLGLTNVPDIYHIPRSAKLSGSDRVALPAGEKLKLTDSIDADGMSRWLRTRTGYAVTIRRSATGSVLMGLITLGVLVLTGRAVIDNLPLVLSKLRNRTLWMWASFGVYAASISGVVFDIIRNPQPFHMDHQTGRLQFFHPQSNNQFVVEGLTVGFLNLSCAAVAIALVTIVPKLRTLESRKYTTIFGMVTFAWLYSTIVSLYRFKNRWYMRT